MNLSDIKIGHVAVSGGKIGYKILNASAKEKPILTFHGGPGTLHDYLEPIAQTLPHHPIIFYDQLGCGMSDQPDNTGYYCLEKFVEHVADIRQTLHLDECHLLGHSFGTMIAFDYMLTNPTGIASLILESPVLSIQKHLEDMQALLKQLPESMQKIIVQGEAEKSYSSDAYNEVIKYICDQHLCRLHPWPEIFLHSIKNKGAIVKDVMWGPSEFVVYGNLKNHERMPLIKNISVNTLITCGRHDLTPSATCKLYQQQFPHAQLVIFEQSSHLPHLEEPMLHAKILQQFILESAHVIQ